MANADRPFGLRPVRYLNGSPWNGKSRPYYMTTSSGTALFIGDPVDITGASNTTEVTVIGGNFPPGTLSTVTHATAGDGNRIVGVVTGVMAANRESTIYREASTARVIEVCDDPNVVFQIQDDASGTLATTDVGLNANLVSGTGSTATGRSGWELDGTTPSADSSNQLLILNLANLQETNDANGGNAVWEVKINTHRYADTGEGGAGEGSLGV